MRRRALALLDDQLRGFDDRHAARGDRARAAGAVAGMDDVAVTLFQPDAFEGDAELEQGRSEEHTSELQSRSDLVCRLLLEKKKKKKIKRTNYKNKTNKR